MKIYQYVESVKRRKRMAAWERQNRERRSAYKREYARRNRAKSQAHSAVRKAVFFGKIVKPKTCEKCGAGRCKLDGHHHNGYAPEHRLDVVFVCSRCHAAERKAERATARATAA